MIEKRHTVRKYLDQPLDMALVDLLNDRIKQNKGKAPEWFNSGIKALLLAPSALNRQPYIVTGAGNKVIFKVKSGFLSQVDLGIGKYFFELGAGKENFEWSSYDRN